MNKHYKRHHIEIIEEFSNAGRSYTYIIDGTYISVGWTSAASAFSAAKTHIDRKGR